MKEGMHSVGGDSKGHERRLEVQEDEGGMHSVAKDSGNH